MKSFEIRDRIDEMRREGPVTRDQELDMLLVEAMLELNQTLIYIKDNTRSFAGRA